MQCPQYQPDNPPPGSILLTAAILRLVEGLVRVTALGPLPVKGLAEPKEDATCGQQGWPSTKLLADLISDFRFANLSNSVAGKLSFTRQMRPESARETIA